MSIIELLSHQLKVSTTLFATHFIHHLTKISFLSLKFKQIFFNEEDPFLKSICSTIPKFFYLLQMGSVLLEFFSIIYCSQHSNPPSKNNMFRTKNIYLILKRPLDCWWRIVSYEHPPVGKSCRSHTIWLPVQLWHMLRIQLTFTPGIIYSKEIFRKVVLVSFSSFEKKLM